MLPLSFVKSIDLIINQDIILVIRSKGVALDSAILDLYCQRLCLFAAKSRSQAKQYDCIVSTRRLLKPKPKFSSKLFRYTSLELACDWPTVYKYHAFQTSSATRAIPQTGSRIKQTNLASIVVIYIVIRHLCNVKIKVCCKCSRISKSVL